MDEKDISKYYKILDLELGASSKEVKEAYLDLIKVWHPDRFLKDAKLQIKSQEKLILINDAYHHLRHFFSRQDALRKSIEDQEKEKPLPKITISVATKPRKIKFRKVKLVKEPKDLSNLRLYTTVIGAVIILIIGFYIFIRLLILFR